jgi:hypothetical protein
MLASGVRAPSAGLHFGSKFLIASKDDEAYEIVPERWMQQVQKPDFFAGELVLDFATKHLDRQQTLFIERAANDIPDVMFFDHGRMSRALMETRTASGRFTKATGLW